MLVRFKRLSLVIVLFVFCTALAFSGCSDVPAPEEEVNEEPRETSPYTESSFSDSGFLMEMAYETYAVSDETVSYTIANTTMDDVTFDEKFSLEYFENGSWFPVPFVSEISAGETITLPGLQMCLVEVSLTLFGGNLEKGEYRLIRKIGNSLTRAEFSVAEQRISARDMSFGFEPLSSLPPDYDAADAENDGCFTLMEDGPRNQEVVQRFADRVFLGVPAKLRTVMLAEDGGTLIRDIVYVPVIETYGFFSVITDGTRTAEYEDGTEAYYSFMSIAKIGNKKKVCLSNYVSYSLFAPEEAPLELISPGAPDNIDLVATVEMRTEEMVNAVPFKFLVFGPEVISFATISQSGDTFSYRIGDKESKDIFPEEDGVILDGVIWMGQNQLLLYGINANGEYYQETFDIE